LEEEFEERRGWHNPYMIYRRRTDKTMAKGKSTKGQTTIYKTYIWNKDRVTRTKWVIRIRKSKKDRQHNGQKKTNERTNNELQNTTQNIKDRVTRTSLKTGVNTAALCANIYLINLLM